MAVSSHVYLVNCCADDIDAAGCAHTQKEQADALVDAIKTGYFGLLKGEGGKILKSCHADTYFMKTWLSMYNSGIAKAWPIRPVMEGLASVMGLAQLEKKINTLFEGTTIQTRGSFAPPSEMYTCDMSLARLYEITVSQVLARLENATNKALAPFLAAGGTKSQVTHLIVGCASFLTMAPGLDVLLAERVGLERDVERFPMHPSLGCAGGGRVMVFGSQLAKTDPEAVVLVTYGDSCSAGCSGSLPSRLTMTDLVSTALFADGAAAAVIVGSAVAERMRKAGYRDMYKISAAYNRIKRSNCLAMQLRMGEKILANGAPEISLWNYVGKDVAATASEELPTFVDKVLAKSAAYTGKKLAVKDLDAVLVHPGGPKIVDLAQESCSITDEQLQYSRATLRERGNMSGCTCMITLSKWLDAKAAQRKAAAAGSSSLNSTAMLIGLGPGFALEGMILSGDAEEGAVRKVTATA